MKTFFEPVQGMAGIEEIKKSFSRLGHAVMVSGCIDTQKAHLLEALGEQYPIRVVITSDEVKARQLREDCLFFDKSSIYYPAKDFIFYSADVHGNQLAGERLACIYKIIQAQKHISEDSISNGKTEGIQPENQNAAGLTVVTTIDGCADLLVPLEKYKNATISFEKGQVLDLEALSKELVQIGYERCAIVDGQGKFAVRGGIIDIFPYTEETPVRIELWDDEVDSIRLFDVESQRSIEKIERFEAFPATECLLSEEEIARGREKLQEELAGQLTAFGNDKKKKTAEDIEKCNRIRRNVADMERTGDYSKALRMFAEELTGFLSYVLLILNSLMMMSNVFLMMTRSLASGARILEVIDEKIDLTDENAKDISVERGEIEFDHVWFKYKEEAKEYVLSDVSFHIKAGQTVGIIGQTGAAKTTLVQLIPRLYDTVRGTVKVDGVDVRNYPMQHLRDAIAMVLQKNTLFSGTMLDNLKWGDENASMTELEEVCKIACVDEFIDRLQDGYQTEMGQGGVNVSGGQKQRLCIARAILKKPKVLILDDSTSAVDTATESRIREGLAEKLPDMTKIIIAQRISSVRHADQIIILDGGRVSGIGTHESLLASNRIYQEIYESQKEGADL